MTLDATIHSVTIGMSRVSAGQIKTQEVCSAHREKTGKEIRLDAFLFLFTKSMIKDKEIRVDAFFSPPPPQKKKKSITSHLFQKR